MRHVYIMVIVQGKCSKMYIPRRLNHNPSPFACGLLPDSLRHRQDYIYMGALRCNQKLIKNNLLVCILTFLLYINHDRWERKRYQPQTICFIIAKTCAEAKEDRELSLPDLTR